LLALAAVKTLPVLSRLWKDLSLRLSASFINVSKLFIRHMLDYNS
jgi:hypothetical protein